MPRRRIKRVILGFMLMLLIIGAGGAYILWRLSWQSPSWYAPPRPQDVHVVQRADDAEYRLLEKSQQLREPADEWTVSLSEAEINAWLSARLPRWIEHDANLRWPEQIGTPQVRIKTGGLDLAVPVSVGTPSNSSTRRTVVATLKPMINPDGRLALPLTSIALGKIWVPGEPLSRLVDAVRGAAPEFLDDSRVQTAIDVLAGRESLPPEYVLTDGRRVVLIGVKLGDGVLELKARTVSGGSPHTNSP